MTDPLEELYKQHKDSVYRFFLRSIMDSHRAEELTQETFLKAFKGIGKFRGDSSLKTWLFTIARNTYINDASKKSNRMEQQVDFTTLDVMDNQNDYKTFDEKMLIQQVLNKLEEKERTFILLRDFQEFTYAEIAEILALSEGQVKIGIYRARKKFTIMYRNQEEGNG